MLAPPRHGGGEEPFALHRVGPWIPVTPVVLVPTLAGGDKIELSDPELASEIARKLEKSLGGAPYSVRDWRDVGLEMHGR